jgi:hypothetical protein
MKKTIARLLVLSLSLTALTFYSCSNDKKEEPEPSKTSAELLTAAKWNLTAVTLYESGGTAFEVPKNYVDDRFIFHDVTFAKDGTARETGAPVAAWALDGPKLTITYKHASDSFVATVVSLDEKKVVLDVVKNYEYFGTVYARRRSVLEH